MSFRHILAKYFNNHAETSDHHWDQKLQTRYYKTTKDKALKMLEDYFRNSQRFEINAVSKEHGELSIQVKKGKKAFIVATVVMVMPFQTAVDFSVTTESMFPFDFGYSTKLVQQLYELIDKELPLVDKR